MPRGKSNRGNNRGESSSRGDSRQNVSSRRGLAGLDDETQRKISSKGGRASDGGRRGRSLPEESDRSE